MKNPFIYGGLVFGRHFAEKRGGVEKGEQGKRRFDDEFFRLWIVRMPD